MLLLNSVSIDISVCIQAEINTAFLRSVVNNQQQGRSEKASALIPSTAAVVANVNVPITLLAKDVLMSVARPRSPIFTEPVGPVIKMLSHLRSRCTIGGVRVCKKCRPFRICLHQLRNTFGFITLKRLRYLWRVNSTVRSASFHGKHPVKAWKKQ